MQQKLIALAGTIRTNVIEIILALLLLVGLPVVAYLYVDLRLALTVFIVFSIALCLLAIKAKGIK